MKPTRTATPINTNEERVGENLLIEIHGENYAGYYLKTRSACRGIVVEDGKILLSYEAKTGQWMIPGGGLESGESEASCVKREIEEETGYLIEVSEPALQINEYYETERYISQYFVGKRIGEGKTALTEREIEVGMEPRWIPLEEAIAIFSKHQEYASEDEMRRGIYLREYMALQKLEARKIL